MSSFLLFLMASINKILFIIIIIIISLIINTFINIDYVILCMIFVNNIHIGQIFEGVKRTTSTKRRNNDVHSHVIPKFNIVKFTTFLFFFFYFPLLSLFSRFPLFLQVEKLQVPSGTFEKGNRSSFS